ncbi:hypothetical protein A9Z05_24670 [Burkholderia sp. A2]|nr:hypothetical protein A9Z05_24670 [Burkholderia sp. A2]
MCGDFFLKISMDNKDHIKDTFDLERARAIDAFSNIESQLCWVMADAEKIDHQIAFAIFY